MRAAALFLFTLGPVAMAGCETMVEPMEMNQKNPPPTQRYAASYVPLERARFQKVVDGKNVDLYTIQNRSGMFAKITNYGAKLEQLVAPDEKGVYGDVVLGYDSIDAALGGQGSMGAFMGRYANRIAGGKFSLDGVEYQLALNDGARPNSVHGGTKGSRFQIFDATQIDQSQLVMSYTFKDGEEGFPGTLALEVHYSITESNELVIAYRGTAVDKKTIFNFTTHPFWNLSDTPGSSIVDHQLTIFSERVLEIDKNLIPTGAQRIVAGTPMDFRSAKPVGKDLGQSYDLLMLAGGYDHTYVLQKSAEGRLALAARLYEPTTGRALEILSTEPGLQVFSGNGFAAQSPRDLGKGGVLYPLRSGLAMEPMHYPDSPNQPTFPSTVLGMGETYEGKTIFRMLALPATKPTS